MDVERAVAVAKNVPAVNQEVVRRVNFVPTVVIILDRCWPRHLKEGDARWMAGVLRIYCEHTVQRKGQQGGKVRGVGLHGNTFPFTVSTSIVALL